MPTYQTDNSSGSAIPLYHKFVQQAQKMNPQYLIMIIPARWYSGGRGLDDFRNNMLNDSHLSELVDFPDSRDCFPNVDIAGGICYFLWQKDYIGKCVTTNIYGGKKYSKVRILNEFPVFVRHSIAVNIIYKIKQKHEIVFSDIVYSSKPFGFRSYEEGEKEYFTDAIALFGSKGISYVRREQVKSNQNLIDKWKVVVSKASAEHAGQTDNEGRKKVLSKVEVLSPGIICSESYLLINTFESENKALNLQIYLKSRFVRFLLSTILLTQNIAKDKFQFVPLQDFSEPWTDEKLYKKYNLTAEEIAFIESMIRPMD